MYSPIHTSNYRKVGKFLFLIMLGLFIAAAPVSGSVRSARARVLSDIGDEDIITNRYAKFDIGSILTSELMKVYVRNDGTEAHLLFNLKITFGGSWEGEYVEVGVLQTAAPNEVIEFTNTEILDYLADINNFEMSADLVTKVGISDISELGNLTGVPEGVYSIEMQAWEVSLDDSGEIIESSKRELVTKTLTFKVVTIGDISSVETPTIDSPYIEFQVPEIPVYDDDRDVSTSTTIIHINGPGVNYTASKEHSKSVAGSSEIKGYPSDTDDGVVRYDVSDVPFRAGETYTVEILFYDWNNAQITLPKTRQFSFPTPKILPEIDSSDPYRPVFSWEFSGTDYSDWVEEYKVYLNGSLIDTTSDDSLEYPGILLPGTVYSWYVMPYNRDGTPFFSSATGLGTTFSTTDHTDLEVFMDSPENGDVLYVGETYAFDGHADYSHDAEFASAQWAIGSMRYDDLTISYTPRVRYAADSLPVYLSITDSLGLSAVSDTVMISVLDPAVSINGADSMEAAVGERIELTAAGQDVDAYEWYLDGSSIGSGSSLSYTFSESGRHELYVIGEASESDMNGNTRQVQSDPVTVTVIGAAPEVSITQPGNGSFLIQGSTVDIAAQVAHENPLDSVTWSIAGTDQSADGTTGESFSFTPGSSGSYTITVTAVDSYDKQASDSIRLEVIDPEVTLTNASDGDTFPLNAEFSPEIDAPNATETTWFIDGREITSSSYAFSDLGTGSFTIFARASWDVIDRDGNIIEYSRDSSPIEITVSDLTPPEVSINFPEDGSVLKTGIGYTFDVTYESDSAITSRWWIVDGKKEAMSSSAAMTYTPTADESGRLITISVSAANSTGITGSDEIHVRIADPKVFVSVPDTSDFLKGSVIPIQATAIDSELYWVIDGVETDDWDKTFEETGTHTVRAGWRLTAMDRSGSETEFTGLADVQTFTIYSDAPPVFTSTTPSVDIIRVEKNTAARFSVSVTSENRLLDSVWKILKDGSSLHQSTGNSKSFSFDTAGQYSVSVETSDIYGKSVRKEWSVRVIDPRIDISAPANGSVFGLGSVPTPTVTSSDISDYSFKLNGTPVGDDFDWNSLRVGTYRLTAVGSYVVTGSAQPLEKSSAAVSFEVKDLTPPEIDLSIQDGTRIIAGETYHFIVNAGNDSVTWLKNGRVAATGDEFRYTPTKDEGSVTITVQAVLNDITAEKTFTLEVIDPSISMRLGESLAYNNRYYPSGIEIPLRYEGQDLDSVEWFIFPSLTPYSGHTVSFEPGTHSISVVGKATNVLLRDLTYGDFEPLGGITGKDIIVVGPQTISRLDLPTTRYSDQESTIRVVTDGDDTYIASMTYSIDGAVFRKIGTPVTKSITIPPLSAGQHSISVEITDVFGRTSSEEATVRVYDRLDIAIERPADNVRISPDSELLASLKVISGTPQRITWKVDGHRIAGGDFQTGSLGTLSPGLHTISVEASDILGSLVSDSVNVEVQSDFQLNLLAPADDDEIIIGNSFTCRAGVEKVHGSSVDLSDAARYITWFVNGRSTGERGLTYTYTGIVVGEFEIHAEYRKGSMVRTTSTRTIAVRDVRPTVINTPENGTTITYSLGDTIALSASGEPGSSYTWKIGSNVIAVGNNTVFDPNGLIGSKQIRLYTTAYGKTQENLVTVNLVQNLPPELTLSAPAKQYTGEPLTWTAALFDAEDNPEEPLLRLYLDGIQIPESEYHRVLSERDIGRHTLLAEVTDTNGISTSKQVVIEVESSDLGLTIQSPADGDSYIMGYQVPLKAALETSIESQDQGTFNWSVQYLDASDTDSVALSGKSVLLDPEYTGEVAIKCTYIDADNRERGSRDITIDIERTPVRLRIYWPHGTVVNAGDPLSPELTGLPDDLDGGTLSWALNGASIDDIETLTAPTVAGTYTLSVQFTQADRSSVRDEVSFEVNEPPEVSITNPASMAQFIAGRPIVLSAEIEDDSEFSGTITWSTSDGTVIGEGNPIILEDAENGDWTVTATAVDTYGATSSAEQQFTVYTPITGIRAVVNNGYPTYLAVPGADPLTASVTWTGGIDPQVSWEFRQGGETVHHSGSETGFTYDELIPYLGHTGVMTLSIRDAGLHDESARQVFRQDYPVTITGDAAAQLLHPGPDDPFWVGDTIPVTIGLTGYNAPRLSLTINGRQIDSSWEIAEGSASMTIAASEMPHEGVYEMIVTVSENGTSQQVPFSLNVYSPRVGIFVDSVPESVDLEQPLGTITAVVSGLSEVDRIQWRTDLSPEPVAFGSTLDLSSAGLVPGERSITVDAISGDEVIASTTIVLQVLGAMTIEVTPDEDPLIVQEGAPFTLQAVARDRDGSTIAEENITWVSHLNGLLQTGSSLDLAALPELSTGEHIVTVEAVGTDGETVSLLKTMLVNAAPENESEDQDVNESGDTEGSDGDSGGDQRNESPDTPTPPTFTPGAPIPPPDPPSMPPMGPGGGPPDPGLDSMFNDFMGGFGGGPMGGFGF